MSLIIPKVNYCAIDSGDTLFKDITLSDCLHLHIHFKKVMLHSRAIKLSDYPHLHIHFKNINGKVISSDKMVREGNYSPPNNYQFSLLCF